jgi:hypothetical protein
MQMNIIQQINAVADVIVNTRDFCGNEREAAFETMAELGVPRRDRAMLFVMAKSQANAARSVRRFSDWALTWRGR